MSHRKSSLVTGDAENLRRRSAADSSENYVDPEQHHRFPQRHSQIDRLCVGPQHPELGAAETPSPDASSHHFCHYTPKCFLTVHRGGHGTSARSTPSRYGEEGWDEGTSKTTIRAENEVEAHREANNYKFGFRKWKGNVTEKPIEDRSDVVKELYSDLSIVKPREGKLCLKLAWYFIWPFGRSLEKAGDVVKRSIVKPPKCEVIPEEKDSEDSKDLVRDKDSSPLLVSSPIPVEIPVPELPARHISKHWCRVSTYIWLLLAYPVLAVVHSLACVLSWLLVFTIPVAKMNARTLTIVLLMAPEDVQIHTLEKSNFAVGAVVNATFGSITEMTFYITALLQGYRAGTKCYEEIVKAALTGTLLGCILFIPGICMIIGGIKHREQRFNSRSAGVSSALLFISIGGVFAPTLFSKTFGNLMCESCTNIPGNTSAPFVCKDCHYDTSHSDPHLILSHIEALVYTISVLLPAAYLIGLIFTLKTHSHIYDIHISDGQGGHAHGQYAQEGTSTYHPTGEVTTGHLGAANSCINASIIATSHVATGHHVVHWSRWRALAVLIVATVLMACCADLSTENIEPMLTHSSISQYFIGVTVLAMVPELPEIVNGIQFALQNNISLSLEVGSCIAVQVCMIQIPLLILFNAFYDVGFVLVFSDIHLWASIFSVILVNYIFMDGKCDYFQGTALVVVYLILLALYFFAPSPRSC
ncbi:hypothetical protein PAMA_013237 [Pampus argenteus]